MLRMQYILTTSVADILGKSTAVKTNRSSTVKTVKIHYRTTENTGVPKDVSNLY